jgi:hypothetical protein
MLYRHRFKSQLFWNNGCLKFKNGLVEVMVISCWQQCILACVCRWCNGAEVLIGRAFPGVLFHKREYGECYSRKECIHTMYCAFRIMDQGIMRMNFQHYRVPLHFSHAMKTYLHYCSFVNGSVVVVYNTDHPISRAQSLRFLYVWYIKDLVYQKRTGNRRCIAPSHSKCCKQYNGLF